MLPENILANSQCIYNISLFACIAEILTENYGVDKSEAEYSTSKYLQEFRKCPEHPSISLDQWRLGLWTSALSDQYRHLSYEIYEQWIIYRYHFMQLPSDLVQMLRQLRKNYLLSIITNGPSTSQWEKIHKLNLNMTKNSLFDCILVSGDCGLEKPDVRIFHAACSYLNVAPQNAIMVGDKLETDIQGAKEAGLLSVWIPLNFPALVEVNEDSVVPDITLSSIYELKSLLVVDDDEPPTTLSTNGNARSLKLKASRSNSNAPLTSTSTSSSSPVCPGTGCFASTKAKANAPYSRRFLSSPELENSNSNASNASDGS